MSGDIKSYRDLLIWQRGVDLVVACYDVAKRFPQNENYGLAAQLQRASVSIPANIAEGHGRKHRGDYLHHLSMARGSLAELETHLLIAVRLTYVSERDIQGLLARTDELGRMISGLIRTLRAGNR